METTTCQYKNHEMKKYSGCNYRDPKNGIEKDIRICDDCYCEHILKYYPESRMAKHLRKEMESEGEQQHADDMDQQAMYNDLARGG